MTIENNNDNEAQTAEQKSNDAKLILAPLAKYAAVAVIMASIIVTTTIMLDRELNTIDQDIASLKAELADANELIEAETNQAETDTVSEFAAAADDAENLVADTDATTAEEINHGNQTVETANAIEVNAPVEATQTQDSDTSTGTGTGTSPATSIAVEVVAKAEDTATAQLQPSEQIVTSSTQPKQTPSQAAASSLTPVSRIDSLKASMQARIADRNSYLDSLDTRSLENFKASQQKMIEMMRQQITRQQDIIEQMRVRNQDAYEMRAASIKRMQEARDRSLERI